jgi:hypothetical protein
MEENWPTVAADSANVPQPFLLSSQSEAAPFGVMTSIPQQRECSHVSIEFVLAEVSGASRLSVRTSDGDIVAFVFKNSVISRPEQRCEYTMSYIHDDGRFDVVHRLARNGSRPILDFKQKRGSIRIRVYTPNGKKVMTVEPEVLTPAHPITNWTLRSESGRVMAHMDGNVLHWQSRLLQGETKAEVLHWFSVAALICRIYAPQGRERRWPLAPACAPQGPALEEMTIPNQRRLFYRVLGMQPPD